MNQNVNFCILADFQSSIDEKWNFFQVHNASLAENCFCANFLDLLDDLFSALLATLGHIVDNDVGAALCELKGNFSTDATNFELVTYIECRELVRFAECHTERNL